MAWIKLYTKILNDYEFHKLPDELAWFTIELMLLSARAICETDFVPSAEILCPLLRLNRDELSARFRASVQAQILEQYIARYSFLKKDHHRGPIYDWQFTEHFDSLFDIGIDRLVGAEWQEIRGHVLERDGYTCQYCGEIADHVDHIVPICQGGGNDYDNLVAACASCNCTKGGRTPAQAGMEFI